jgi:twitching motility protein PilT
MIDVFPADQQNQIRFQLAGSLVAVVSQRLVPRFGGGFVPACEVMICNPAISNLIRENKTHEIPSVLETSVKEGMMSFNRSLSELVKRKEVSPQDAATYSINPDDLKNLL